jgi:hypothetical protein
VPRIANLSLIRIALIAPTLALGACSMPDMDTFRAPDTSIFAPRSVAVAKASVQRPVTAEDMVDGEGRCASAAPMVAPNADPSAPQTMSVPLVPSGIALEMTECDVVKRAGAPERTNIGTNERGERTTTLTYMRGEKPGIYYFAGGRLTSMERVGEPPAPPKPAKPAKAKSKPKPKPKPQPT